MSIRVGFGWNSNNYTLKLFYCQLLFTKLLKHKVTKELPVQNTLFVLYLLKYSFSIFDEISKLFFLLTPFRSAFKLDLGFQCRRS